MAEYRFNEKKNEIRLQVKKARIDGGEEEKVLVFDCAPTNYGFIRKARAAGERILEISKDQSSFVQLEELFEAEKMAFETVAPGKWEEYFEFLDGSLSDMSALLLLMVQTVTAKCVEEKRKAVSAAVEDGESI